MDRLLEFPLLAQSALDVGLGPGVTPGIYWGWIGGGTGIILLMMLLFTYGTRAGIIARATTKECVRQPVFVLLLAVGIFVLLINTILPFFSMGDDVKMLKDCGNATLLLSSLILAVWTSSTTIADEIEGKTAMTLLSKPINRRQFVIGKYIGVLQAVLLLLFPLMICLVSLVYYKVGYDAREASKEVPDLFAWAKSTILPFSIPIPTGERLASSLQIIPGLLLIVFEAAILTAISVAISTRLPMVVNMVTCFAIFVVGHLTPILVQVEANDSRLELVQAMAKIIATVLPGLENFNTQAVVATGSMVPVAYMGLALCYTVAYCMAGILLAFILFEDRDLA